MHGVLLLWLFSNDRQCIKIKRYSCADLGVNSGEESTLWSLEEPQGLFTLHKQKPDSITTITAR